MGMSFFRRRRSIFDMFDEIMREFEEEFSELEREFERMVREGGAEIRGPYVYGFRVTIGPDGRPIVEEFGNIRREAGRPRITEEREPLVDVFEDDNSVVVVAELPGVEKDKIKLRVVDNKLVIRASNEHRKYYKEVELPAKVRPDSAKATYKNGVLEVKLEKVKEESREEGVEIKVE
jgi:HSP20 family protein